MAERQLPCPINRAPAPPSAPVVVFAVVAGEAEVFAVAGEAELERCMGYMAAASGQCWG